MVKYLSQEWVDAIRAKTQIDEEYLKKGKGLTDKQKAVFTDCPGNVDILVIWDFDDGKLVNATREEKPAPSEWRKAENEPGYLSTIIGSYESMARIARKELNAQAALGKKLYEIHGDQLKLFSKMGKLNAFSTLCASIETEF